MPTDDELLELQRFREAMSLFPSGATLVTTIDGQGRWWGFTATSFCSVSMSPPLVLACLDKAAQCHPAFQSAQGWAIHFVHRRHTKLAYQFATKGIDKFAGAGFQVSDGLPILPDASVILYCSTHSKQDGGDHTMLLGRVEKTYVGRDAPSVYFQRRFHVLNSGSDAAEGSRSD